MNKTIYLACHHDRHTDDVYKAFVSEEKAKQQCREWMSHWKTEPEVNRQYGDWCLYISDDYHAFVQQIEVDNS